MVARRMIDAAHQDKKHGLLLLLLDWAKAFDRVKPQSLVTALRRFGLPSAFVQMIQSIYTCRNFFIQDHAGNSQVLPQSAGIAQGSPLSPYLFIIVQTVLMHDVHSKVQLAAEPPYIVTPAVLYADDTLLASSSAANLQQLLEAIVEEGLKYGLELNWEKTLQMQISTASFVLRPDGQPIKSVREAIYLGGVLACDGRTNRELCRRLGEGTRSLEALAQVWSHSGISRRRKIRIYMAVVVSKVLYSLDSLWLLQSDLRRLDAFHCRSLRKVLRIPCSYVSRISNEIVLENAGSMQLSKMLTDRQISLYKKIAQKPDDSFVKQLVCTSSGEPIRWQMKRGRGRPRQQWCQSVFNLLTQAPVHSFSARVPSPGI